MIQDTTENIAAYQEGWNDAKADDSEKIIDALRKARKYIKTVEAWTFIDNDTTKAIEDALAELGVIDEI